MGHISVIFDLDGTLLDTLTDLAVSCNEVLKAYSFPIHPVVAYKSFVGGGLQSLMKRTTPSGTSDQTLMECCALFAKVYQKNWKRNSCLYDGINDMVVELKKHGILLAIFSNKPHDFTKIIVKEYFPHELFFPVYGQRDGFPKKPDPSVAFAIAKQHGARPEDTLFVGDSAVDIMTGRAAGMFTAGVTWGFRTTEELVKSKADYIIEHPMELVRHVLSAT